jgi:hypothetical protein
LRFPHFAECGFFAANHSVHFLQPLELGEFLLGLMTAL